MTSATSSKSRIIDPWLLSVAVIWGMNFVAYKVVLRELPPLAIIGARFALMAPLLLLVTAVFTRTPLPDRSQLPSLLWAGIVVLGAQQISFIIAVNLSSASEAALIISTAPIFTGIIATLLRQERLTAINWLGIIIGFAGVALVVLAAPSDAAQYPHRVAGDLLMLFSAVMYGYFMVLAKPIVQRCGGLRTVACCYTLGALVIVPVAARDMLRVHWLSVSPAAWAWLIGYIILLAGVYGFTVWYTTIGRTSAARTAVYQYLVPVIAMIGAALFLGERPAPLQIVGAAIALVGVAFARWPTSPTPPGSGSAIPQDRQKCSAG